MPTFVNVDADMNGDRVDVWCRHTGSKWNYYRGKLHNSIGPAYTPGPNALPIDPTEPKYFLEGEQLSYEDWFRKVNADQIQP